MSLDELLENLVFSATYIGVGNRFSTVHAMATRCLIERYGVAYFQEAVSWMRWRLLSEKLNRSVEQAARRLFEIGQAS